MDLGLLLLRIALAAILLMHSTQKSLGWFSGLGLDKQGAVFHNLGHRPGRQMALLAAVCEAAGAVLVVLGLATPLGAAVLAGTMIVAGMTLTMAKGTVWNVAGGGEYPLVLATVAVILGFTGPGAWSGDAAISAPWISHSNARAAIIGVVVLAVAVIAAAPPLLRVRANLAAASATADAPPTSASA
jgi:putative oxidoreductase